MEYVGFSLPLQILAFFEILDEAKYVPVSLFIPMVALLGCVAGLCLYFFVKYQVLKHQSHVIAPQETALREAREARRDTPAGTLLSTTCNGMNLHGTYADGNGGSYAAVIEVLSERCGFVPTKATATSHQTTTRASEPEPSTPRRRRSDARRDDADVSVDDHIQMQRTIWMLRNGDASSVAPTTHSSSGCSSSSWDSSGSDSSSSSSDGGSAASCD